MGRKYCSHIKHYPLLTNIPSPSCVLWEHLWLFTLQERHVIRSHKYFLDIQRRFEQGNWQQTLRVCVMGNNFRDSFVTPGLHSDCRHVVRSTAAVFRFHRSSSSHEQQKKWVWFSIYLSQQDTEVEARADSVLAQSYITLHCRGKRKRSSAESFADNTDEGASGVLSRLLCSDPSHKAHFDRPVNMLCYWQINNKIMLQLI